MGNGSKIYLGGTVLKNCSEMTIYDFLRSSLHGELFRLVKSGWKPKKEVLESHLESVIKELAFLRNETTDDSMRFDMISYKEELELQCKFGLFIIERLQQRVSLKLITSETFTALIDELKAWGFEVDPNIPLIDLIQNTICEIQALQTTIEAMHAQLYPEGEESTEKTPQQHEMTFYAMLLSYARILDIEKINIKETTLMELVVIEQNVKEFVKRNKAA